MIDQPCSTLPRSQPTPAPIPKRCLAFKKDRLLNVNCVSYIVCHTLPRMSMLVHRGHADCHVCMLTYDADPSHPATIELDACTHGASCSDTHRPSRYPHTTPLGRMMVLSVGQALCHNVAISDSLSDEYDPGAMNVRYRSALKWLSEGAVSTSSFCSRERKKRREKEIWLATKINNDNDK